MEYMKVWTSFLDIVEPLSDDELGRLFRMMMIYTFTGEEPPKFDGNERYLWPVAKQQIDLAASKVEKMRENGLKGGRPANNQNQTKPNESKEKQIKPNESKEKQTETNERLNVKDNVYIKDKENKKETSYFFDRFWNAYPRHVNKPGAMKAFDKAKIDGELLDMILKAIERQKASNQWTKDNGQFIPHPATWLNQRRWEDETPIIKSEGKTLPAQDFPQRDYKNVNDELMDSTAKEVEEFLAKEVG